MIFRDLMTGDSVFLDANTFVYHFAADSKYGAACSELIQRIETGDVLGFTSTHVVTELAHRMMTIEAIVALQWPVAGIAVKLRKNPDEVRKLGRFQQAVETVLNSRIQVLSVTPTLTSQGPRLSQQTGLLSNDAMVLAAMTASGLRKIASNDSDFDRITGVQRYSPA
ncbi:MAG: PIN domain-containing protein [Pirellulaceae bacterium]|nr:PIN domain-containing protein [Pirellulaceae bacterium]